MRQLVWTSRDLSKNTLPSAVLGGKGSGLALLVRMGVPTPPFFVIGTTGSRAYLEHHRPSKRMTWHVARGVQHLHKSAGKKLGDPNHPLFVSVRSGAEVSMPGMLDTILNIGLNGRTYEWLNRLNNSSGFADACASNLLKAYKQVREDGTLPEHVLDQLSEAILYVFTSWNNPSAKLYRQEHGISERLGTAVIVQQMVFGNLNKDSCSGVAFSHDYNTGKKRLSGEFLPVSQGEEVVSGTSNPLPLHMMKSWNEEAHRQLVQYMNQLRPLGPVDVEFTVEDGKTWILQVRKAKMAKRIEMKKLVHRVWSGEISKEEASSQVSLDDLRFATMHQLDTTGRNAFAQGVPASPGAASGLVVCNPKVALNMAKNGTNVILVVEHTKPQDLNAIMASKAVVTRMGGKYSHAAIVARELGKPAVVGADIDPILLWSNTISVDGRTGKIYKKALPLKASEDCKELNLLNKWKLGFSGIHPRSIDWSPLFDRQDFNVLIAEFYVSMVLEQKTQGTKLHRRARSLTDRINLQTANTLVVYIIAAVSGELRHAEDRATEGNNIYAESLSILRDEFNVIFGGDRHTAQLSVLKVLQAKPEEALRFLKLSSRVFFNGIWETSYGGHSWANIALAGVKYFEGLPLTVFIDHAFDLQHNSGTMFGKNSMLMGDRERAQRQLNLKSDNDGWDLVRAMVGSVTSLHLSDELRSLMHDVEKEGL